MTLIDTSAWIEFFRKTGNPIVKRRVAAFIMEDKAVYTCPILFELLVGARPSEAAFIHESLGFCERIVFEPNYWEKAASIERKLRDNGVTVPRDDIFVATVASVNKLTIYCVDRHFDLIKDKGKISIGVEQGD